MSNDQLDKLKAEEAEMEAVMFGTPEEPTVEPVVEAPQVEPTVVEPVVEPTPTPRTNWKKRFSNYKSSTDSTIHSLRREIMDLKGELAMAMEATLHREEAPVDMFEGTFSQEDEDTFGAEGLAVVKKAANALVEKQVKPLNEKLKKAEQKRLDTIKAQSAAGKQEEYRRFLDTLSRLVPNYASINVDQGFLEWMKLPDSYSGLNRGELFRRAEASGDVVRVADFFVEYQGTLKAAAPTVTVEEIDITPVGSGGAEPVVNNKNNNEEVIYTSEINKFYSDLTKGRYEGQHETVMKIEAKIDHAQMNGLIRQG